LKESLLKELVEVQILIDQLQAKQGSTSDLRDAWFAGYTPELVTIVWMGHQDTNKAMEPINDRVVVGGSFPSDVWREFMSEALKINL
jgi:penicillin-binding protein 1A